MDAIFRRVSIRKYEERAVEAEKLERLMKAAMAAPSAGNQQPWEFYVVRDKELLKGLAGCSPYARCAADAPLVIVPCYRRQGLRHAEYAQIDMSIATEHLLLEATQLGLGAVWLGIAPLRERMAAVHTLLGLPPELEAFALVPLGYPAEEREQESRYDRGRVHEL